MGDIFTRADTVLIWLGASHYLAQILHTMNMATAEHEMDLHAAMLNKLQGSSACPPQSQDEETDVGSWFDVQRPETFQQSPDFASRSWKSIEDSSGKVEKLLEGITKHEYWTRAWVTQEVLLPRSTFLVAGTQTHDLFSLASRFRTAVPYFQDSAFENIVDIRT
jgi:hypothetical protein